MENSKTAENNLVSLSGIISEECVFSHEVYGEGFYIFKMEVKRLSDNEDILPITVSDRLLDVTSLKKGMNVCVKGQLRSYNHYSSKKNKLILTTFAREIIMEPDPGQNPNEIFLNGFVCKAPVYRTTPFGREISDLLIAVNRNYGKSDYIPCIAWGRNAKFAGSLDVGSNVELWGRIQSRVYQKRIDEEMTEERTAYEVSLSKIELVHKPEDEE
ncbi:MAG: single-stranded DNA-binding protein [Candidatus Metalachnospira sp.]|nr:single-stranded DNA-binding protein [Candidatus Metalachnospira sp.]